jgi:hypothetical protein
VSVEGGVTRGVPWMPRTSPEDDELVVVDDTEPVPVVVSLVDVLVLDSLLDWLVVSLVELVVLEVEDEVVSLVELVVLEVEDDVLVLEVEVEVDDVSLVDVLVLVLEVDVVVVSVQLSELDFEL